MRWMLIALGLLALGLTGCPKDREPGFDPAKGSGQTATASNAGRPASFSAERADPSARPRAPLGKAGIRRLKPAPGTRVMKPGKRPPRLMKGIRFAPKE